MTREPGGCWESGEGPGGTIGSSREPGPPVCQGLLTWGVPAFLASQVSPPPQLCGGHRERPGPADQAQN